MTWWWFTSALVQVAPGAPALVLPVDCVLTQRCAIQTLPDRDPGPGRSDFRCGALATDGHDGTDFRLRRFADLNGSAPVVAAADGTVLRVRDGMADRNIRAEGAGEMGDRMAGNGVVIDHGGGWQTQYSHLKRGSVRVTPGTRVAAGTAIGAIGMSGNAEFPHLHFTLRHGSTAVDPFDARPVGSAAACDTSRRGLWRDPAAATWVSGNEILALGFATGAEDARARRIATDPAPLPPDPEALVLWVDVAGLEAGAVERYVLRAPGGGVLFDRQVPQARGYLSWFGFSGVRRPDGGWPRGDYIATYTIDHSGITRKASARLTLE